MTKLNLKEIEARCEMATPGPWEIYDDSEVSVAACSGRQFEALGIMGNYATANICRSANGAPGHFQTKEDASFVAAARSDVPLMAECIRELAEALRKFNSDWMNRPARKQPDPRITMYESPTVREIQEMTMQVLKKWSLE